MRTQMLALAAIMSISGAAMANTGTITFDGTLTDSSCVVKIEGGTENYNLDLGTYSVNQFAADGSESTPIAFSMSLSGCSGTTINKVSATFAGTATTDANLFALAGLTGVGVKIRKGATVMVPNAGPNDSAFEDLSGNDPDRAATLNFDARLSKITGVAPIAGTGRATVTYNIVYK